MGTGCSKEHGLCELDFEGVTLSETDHLWVSVTTSGPIKLCVHSQTDFQTVALKLTEEKFIPLRIAVGRSRLEDLSRGSRELVGGERERLE